MTNFWCKYREKRYVKLLIDRELRKFIGRKLHPRDELIANMKKVVFKYFKKNPESIKHFVSINHLTFDFHFEIEEQAGYVTNVGLKI